MGYSEKPSKIAQKQKFDICLYEQWVDRYYQSFISWGETRDKTFSSHNFKILLMFPNLDVHIYAKDQPKDQPETMSFPSSNWT